MHPFFKNLARQAEENPAGALAAGAVAASAVTKILATVIGARNSHVWAKEVARRAMKDQQR